MLLGCSCELLTRTTAFDTEELINSGLERMRQIVRERLSHETHTSAGSGQPIDPSLRSIKNRKLTRIWIGLQLLSCRRVAAA
jgi:hypothetical protein